MIHMTEPELKRLCIYQTIDYFKKMFTLSEQKQDKFKLSNGAHYRIKHVYSQYVYVLYKGLFGSTPKNSIDRETCDYMVFTYPINENGYYRSDYLFVLIRTQTLRKMILAEEYISNSKSFLGCFYKFSIDQIIKNGTLLN
jgi:hypothetical protein